MPYSPIHSLVALAGVSVLGLVHYLGPYVLGRLQRRRLKDNCERSRTLVLTYDDGPTRNVTPALLDLLASRGVSATFFLLGHRAVQAPDLVERIANDGHEIGCHSFAHENAWKVSPWRATRDVTRGYEALSGWLGERPLYRPPFGKVTLPAWVAARRLGFRFGWWTLDSHDTHWARLEPASIAEQVRQSGGGVVLMHDCPGPQEHVDYLLEATEALLAAAQDADLQVVTLGRLLSEANSAESRGIC